MEDYNFWADFFDTYQSLSDWVKILWLIVPPAFLLAFVALILRYRLASRPKQHLSDGDLIYTVHRDKHDQYRVYRHDPNIERHRTIVLLEQSNYDQIEPQYPGSQS